MKTKLLTKGKKVNYLSILSVFILFILATNISFAQCTFFIDNGKTAVTSISGEDKKEITITIALPENVTSYDSYTINAYFGPEKWNISAKIIQNNKVVSPKFNGKKEITLLLISADGKSSDFTYNDGESITDHTLYTYFSEARIASYDLTIKATGWMITGYRDVTELKQKNPPVYVTNHYPVWDNGTVFTEGKLTVNNKTISRSKYLKRRLLIASPLIAIIGVYAVAAGGKKKKD